MGFFDVLTSVAKNAGEAAKNANVKMIEETWKKLSSLSKNRLEGLIEEKSISNTVGFLAYLRLRQFDSYSANRLVNSEDEIKRKAASMKRAIEMHESDAIDEIRREINRI
ncbi:hypothetical protein KXJ75_04175 [Aeromonas sanarellii]|nr:hypothetical protein KXJ75_04175 [Aeromonas sanarellii]